MNFKSSHKENFESVNALGGAGGGLGGGTGGTGNPTSIPITNPSEPNNRPSTSQRNELKGMNK